MDKPEPTTFGPYRVVRKLGSGGMGTVYEAKHELLDRSFAIKTLGERVHLTADARARFIREARAAAKVRHRNVVQVHDVSTQDDVPYMVMELLRGQTLGALLETHALLSPEKAADLLVPLVAGVAAAHACGIVHRDLKPQNLFIAEEHSSVVPRVLDFGISKFVDEGVPVHTRSDVILGTAHYMSPEQARGDKELDARSDQYSLAAVLYECVAGRKPFDDDNLYVLINRIGAGEFKPPSERYSGVPSALEAVILKAMSRAPSDRYATTALFGQALLPFSSYKTRLNYAQEFAEFGKAATTSPFDQTDLAAFQAPVRETRIEPVSGASSTSRTNAGSRQWFAALALLSLGAGVGYAVNRAPSVSNATGSQPTDNLLRTDNTAHHSLSNAEATQALEPVDAASLEPHANVTLLPSASTHETSVTLALPSPSGVRAPFSAVRTGASSAALSSPPAVSSVAGAPPFVQKTAVVPATTASNTTHEQNRAQVHGLVQEDPF